MNRRFAIFSLPVVFIYACSVDPNLAPVTLHSGATMGTTFSVSVAAQGSQEDAARIRARIDESLEYIDAQMSTYRSDSKLSGFNAHLSTEWFSVPDSLCRAIEAALEISRMTAGAFDITVGPLVNLWGFGPAASGVAPPADEEIAVALMHTGFGKLETDCANNRMRKADPHLYIDLSGYAKGLAVDRIASVLDDFKIEDYLVEIGGELRARGTNGSSSGWRIAIEKPLPHERSVQRIVNLANQAMASSGDYRNFFESGGKRYSHTIDPRSGAPVQHALAAVTVVAGETALADALATALLVMGPVAGPEFATQKGIAALFLVHDTGGITERASEGFRDLAAH